MRVGCIQQPAFCTVGRVFEISRSAPFFRPRPGRRLDRHGFDDCLRRLDRAQAAGGATPRGTNDGGFSDGRRALAAGRSDTGTRDAGDAFARADPSTREPVTHSRS